MEPLPKVEDLAPKLRGHGIDLPAGVIRVGAFGDSAALSEELLALIRAGRKRGGASLLWAYESDSEPIPSVGDTEIVVNHRPRVRESAYDERRAHATGLPGPQKPVAHARGS